MTWSWPKCPGLRIPFWVRAGSALGPEEPGLMIRVQGIPPSPPRDTPRVWLVDPTLAWVPIVAADVWKTTPFVALLLLAGLQNIDDSLYDAARIDGARPWREFVEITLPLLRPALVVALAFRALDAFRVFDLVYVPGGTVQTGHQAGRVTIDLPFGLPRYINAATLKALVRARPRDLLFRKTAQGWEICPDSNVIDVQDNTAIFRIGKLEILS